MKLRVIRSIQALLFCALVCAVTMESSAQVSSLGSVIDESGFALLVDVSDYKDPAISPLKSKSQEVDKIRSALESVGGFPSQQIQMLSNEKATRQAIIEALTTVVERTKNQMNARFLFYLKGRSLKTPGKNYFLPYDAQVGAVSTYIEENELMNWFNRVPSRIKAFIWATWNVDDSNDSAFSSQLATILASEETDADANRNVILAEVEAKILRLGFRGDYPIRITGDRSAVLIRLSAALEVNSQPPGATIMLNGTEKGMTPRRIVGLTPGTHRIRLKKDLYRMTEEQTVSISTARGERVSLLPYQLTPIKVYGTVRDANGKVLSGVEVQIAGTGYKKTVDQEGKFSFENWQSYGRKVSEGDLTSDIFTYLRHMMQNFDNLSFIFAGSRDFARRQRREWALMFNIAQPKEVSFLSRDDATALITEPVKDYVRYDKKAIDRILRLTAGQPYFAQAICIHIIDFLNDKKQNRATVERVEEACRDIVENAPYHFTYIWSELTTDEKILISLLAEVISDEMAYAAVDEIASRLSHYNLQYSQADISKTLSRLIEEHLVEKKPEVEAYRFLMDLSRLWIKAEHPTCGVLKEVQSE